MAQLSHVQYEMLERSVARGERLSIFRRGTEYVVIPLALMLAGGREVISARHPTTGELLSLYVDEIDGFEVVR